MDAYQVGKLFPIEQYCTGREMYVGLPTEGFFNVLISLKKISRRERKLFKNGKITAYLFEKRDIPFLIVDRIRIERYRPFSCGSDNRHTRKHAPNWRGVCSAIARYLRTATGSTRHWRACRTHSCSLHDQRYDASCCCQNTLQTASLAGLFPVP